MIEAEIEARICAAIEEAVAERVNWGGRLPRVSGLWRCAAEVRRGPELGQVGVSVYVAVSPRSFDTFGISTCAMDVSIALSVRIDLCPGSADLEKYAGPISELLQRWNRTMDCEHPCGLAVEGEFQPGGLQVTPGSGPALDRASGVWAVTFNFTLRGSIPDAHPENQQGD